MNEQEKALRDAFLAECWKPVRELSRVERERQRNLSTACAETVDSAGEKRPA